MIILFSDDNVLLNAVQVAVNRAVPVQREEDVRRYLNWIETSFQAPTAVIVDCRNDSGRALAMIDEVSARLRSVPVVAVVESSDSQMAYEVGDRGVAGWIPAPCHSDSVRERLLHALGRRDSFGEVRETPRQLRQLMIGGSSVLEELRSAVVKASTCKTPVLVAGETGSGKELVARGIHALSESSGPFITANMAAVAPSIFESELFGSRQGAFTGARDKDGLFQAARNGTLFLDEISEMAPELQPKLLRAVESMEVRAVGANTALPVQTRIISATNHDLSLMRRTGRIRQDLWYRLAGLIIRVPPLREHLEDIPALSQALLESEGLGDTRLSHSAVQMLRAHRWPGNVRELRSVLVRSVVMSGKRKLHGRDIQIDRNFGT